MYINIHIFIRTFTYACLCIYLDDIFILWTGSEAGLPPSGAVFCVPDGRRSAHSSTHVASARLSITTAASSVPPRRDARCDTNGLPSQPCTDYSAEARIPTRITTLKSGALFLFLSPLLPPLPR